ncbi:MAG: methionine aminotransferase [Cyclobacteriaceae bacterium]
MTTAPIKPINSKLPDEGTTIFTIMSKMALDHGAINLSQGFPDFDISAELIDLVHKFMQKGANQYAPMQGVPAFREAISSKIKTCYDADLDPISEITVTAGATEALYSAITALVEPGDEVIIFDPAYDLYHPAVLLNQGIPIHITLTAPDFAIDWSQVEDRITNRTKLIVVNTPNNPAGVTLSPNDLDQLTKLVEKHGMYLLSDEAYEHIIFDKTLHQSILRYPALREQGIAISSFGKTFHATGWKIGYLAANKRLTEEIRKVHQFVTFSINTPIQHALAAYLEQPDHYLQLPDFYQSKRDYFLELMAGSRFKPLKCQGTYFQVMDYTGMSDLSDMEMAEWMTKTQGVAAIPFSVFYQHAPEQKLLRFCFAKKESTLEQAAEILCKI